MTPSSRQYLSGPWGAAEESGTWSSEESSVVTFNLPSDFPPGAVDIAVTSSVFATDSHPQSLAVVVNGKELLTETFVQSELGTLSFTIPAGLIDVTTGRVEIEFRTGTPIPRSEGEDARPLTFYLSSLDVAPTRGWGR